MALPNLQRAALSLSLFAACVADDAKELATSPTTADGTESIDGTPADTDEPDTNPDRVPDPDPFLSALDRIEFSTPDGTRIELLAYDADDQLIGTLAIQIQGIENIQLIADFEDGAALVEVNRDTVTMRHSDLPDVVVARRVEAVVLATGTGGQERWWKCAAMTALTIHNCWNPATAVWACGVSSFLTACECLDYLADKYGWMHDEC